MEDAALVKALLFAGYIIGFVTALSMSFLVTSVQASNVIASAVFGGLTTLFVYLTLKLITCSGKLPED